MKELRYPKEKPKKFENAILKGNEEIPEKLSDKFPKE